MDGIDSKKAYLIRGSLLIAIMRVINAVLQMRGRDGIKVHVSDGNIVVAGGGLDEGGEINPVGGGLPDGYTFEEFTICDSGTPATRFIATWTSDPS